MIIVFQTSFILQDSANIIIWSEGDKLTWKDFEGASKDTLNHKNHKVAAISVVSIKYDFDFDEQKRVVASVIAYFNKSKSWTRKVSGTLPHEQLHFDVAEIYARKFRKQLRNKRFLSKKIGVEAGELYINIMKEYNSYQHLYDSLTENNNNTTQQKAWAIKIAEELKALEKYKENKFKIKTW